MSMSERLSLIRWQERAPPRRSTVLFSKLQGLCEWKFGKDRNGNERSPAGLYRGSCNGRKLRQIRIDSFFFAVQVRRVLLLSGAGFSGYSRGIDRPAGGFRFHSHIPALSDDLSCGLCTGSVCLVVSGLIYFPAQSLPPLRTGRDDHPKLNTARNAPKEASSKPRFTMVLVRTLFQLGSAFNPFLAGDAMRSPRNSF